MGLFSDIYNTVAKFFRPQEITDGEPSKSVAANRLKLVLMQDRTNLTPKILEQMRGELIDLLSRYVELDKELLELNFEQEGEQVALMLSIPVIRAKDEEEIEAAIKAAKLTDEEISSDESESVDEITDNVENSTEDDAELSSETDDNTIENDSNDTENLESDDNTEEITDKDESVQEAVSKSEKATKKKKVSTPDGIIQQKDSNNINSNDNKAECPSE